MTNLGRFLDRSRAPAWAFFFLALTLRVGAVAVAFEDRLYFADEAKYFRLAGEVAGGDWIGEETYAPPITWYLYGVGRLIGLDLFGLRVLNALFGAATVALLFLIGRRLFGAPVAAAAALAASAYPYLLYLPGVLYPQNVFQLTLAVLVYLLLRYREEGRFRLLLLAGVALGISALTVVAILPASLVIAAWLLAFGPGRLGRRVRDVAVLATLTVLVILPWTARNQVVTGRFVLISEMGGPAFFWANNPEADPYDRDAEAWLERYTRRHDREQARQGWAAADMNDVLQFRAARFVRDEWPRALRNYLIRLGMFFDVAPRSFTSNDHTSGGRSTLVAIVSSVPVLLLVPFGLWFGRRRWRELCLIVGIVLLMAMAYAAFHVSVRYRFPFEPYLILLATVGARGLIGPGRGRSPKPAS